MQHATLTLTRTPAFDFHAFLAGTKTSRALGVDPVIASRPMHVSSEATDAAPEPQASTRWLVDLHLAAARRWLTSTPVRRDEVASSLRCVAAIVADSHPANASEALATLDGGVDPDQVRLTLDRLAAVLGPVRH